MVELLSEVGLTEVQITARFDRFRGTSKEGVAADLGVHGVNVFARSAGIRTTL